MGLPRMVSATAPFELNYDIGRGRWREHKSIQVKLISGLSPIRGGIIKESGSTDICPDIYMDVLALVDWGRSIVIRVFTIISQIISTQRLTLLIKSGIT